MLKRWLVKSNKKGSHQKDATPQVNDSTYSPNSSGYLEVSHSSSINGLHENDITHESITHIPQSSPLKNGSSGSAIYNTNKVNKSFDFATDVIPEGFPLDGMNSPILSTPVTELLPYGDGSNKVFGYENFGNTCYLNSVLQCLYNIEDFRINILKYPVDQEGINKQRKLQVNGKLQRNMNEILNVSAMKPSSGQHGHPLPNESFTRLGSPDKIGNGRRKHSDIRRIGPDNEKLDENISDYSPRTSVANITHNEELTNSSHVESNTTFLHDGSAYDSNTRGLTEKIHQYSRKVIVGRILPNSRKSSADLLKDFNTNTSIDNVDESITSDSHIDTRNISSNRLTSDQKKRAALLRGPIINLDYPLDGERHPKLYDCLKDIFESVNENESLTGIVSPTQFMKTLKKENVLFNTMMHQDAHEFLNFLLNDLSEYTEQFTGNARKKSIEHNFIKDLFQGILTSRMKCLTCDSVTSRDEPFLDFAIEVQDGKSTDVQDVLKSFHQRELLNGTNKFYCNQCSGLQEAERVVGLKQLPCTLALHLKRFEYSEEQNCNIKLFNKIHYPLILNVKSTFDASVSKTYELSGIVIHMGGGPQHGHYVSLCKTEKFGWLFYDDETVETVSEDTVLKFTGDANNQTTAYVLFYRDIEMIKNDDKHTNDFYQNNINELIRCDDIIYSETKPTATNLTLDDETDDHVINVNGDGKNVDKPNRRKSKLFGFIKNEK